MFARPHISVNLALSADGKLSTDDGRRSDWTSEHDRQRFLALRQPADALMVGRATWETDNMTMANPPHALRCVVSRQGRFHPDHPIFRTAGGAIHLLVSDPHAEFDMKPLEDRGATIHRQSLKDFLSTLHGLGVKHLHCEGGGELLHALAELDVLDVINLTWAGHTIFSGKQAPTLTGVPANYLPVSQEYELEHFESIDHVGECFLTYRRKRG